MCPLPYSYLVPAVSWWSFLRTSAKPFTCFLGRIFGLNTASVITSTLGVLFLASRCFPWDIWFMRLQSDRPNESPRSHRCPLRLTEGFGPISMTIPRITGAIRLLACTLLICAAVAYGPRPAFAQTTDSSGEQTQRAEPDSGTPQSSRQAQKTQQQPDTQEAVANVGCSVHGFFHQAWSEASQFGRG